MKVASPRRSSARIGLSLGLALLLAAAAERSAPPAPDAREQWLARLTAAAIEQTTHPVTYDGRYVRMPYPGGDVPADRGVCSDVLIRAYRKVGVDLQKEVHEDMQAHFRLYPRLWGLTRPDSNIDHRRVPNLMVFFQRRGEVLPITLNPENYAPGEIVAWDLGGGVTHVGLVVDRKAAGGNRYLIVHNIGAGPQLEDVLFAYRIIGHFRYGGPRSP